MRDEQKVDQAKETLKSIWRRLLALSVTEMHNTEERDQTNNVSTGSDNISFEFDPEGELQKYLTGKSPN